MGNWLEGWIRGTNFSTILSAPKVGDDESLLLLSLYEHRFSKGDDIVLKSIIFNLHCFDLVIKAMEIWGYEDDEYDYLKPLSNKHNTKSSNKKENTKVFIFDTQKRNCYKCQIFVARAYAMYQSLVKEKKKKATTTTDEDECGGGSSSDIDIDINTNPLLKSKIKDCLDIMNKNVRVVNQIEFDKLQKASSKRQARKNKDNNNNSKKNGTAGFKTTGLDNDNDNDTTINNNGRRSISARSELSDTSAEESSPIDDDSDSDSDAVTDADAAAEDERSYCQEETISEITTRQCITQRCLL